MAQSNSSDFRNSSFRELQLECKRRGIKANGKFDDLLDRLTESMSSLSVLEQRDERLSTSSPPSVSSSSDSISSALSLNTPNMPSASSSQSFESSDSDIASLPASSSNALLSTLLETAPGGSMSSERVADGVDRSSVIFIASPALGLPALPISGSEVVRLVAAKRSSNADKPQMLREFKSWLNENTIDCIVGMRRQVQGTDFQQDNSPSPANVYLGSSYTPAILLSISDDLIRSLQTLDPSQRQVLVVWIVNIGLHWVLLLWRPGQPLHLVDPMASTHIDQSLLLLAARLADRRAELALALNVDVDQLNQNRQLSLRSVVTPALEQGALSFFRLANVGVQLEQNDGHNCGLYCALWARRLLGRPDPVLPLPVPQQPSPTSTDEHDDMGPSLLPRWSQTHMKLLRLRWQRRLDATWTSADPSACF